MVDRLADEGVHLGEPFTGLEHRKAGEGGERDAAKHRRRPHRGGGLMTGRPSWDEVKAARTQSPERRRGHEKAGRAIRLAMQIRALREARGLSQRELAERVGTTQSAIARLEGGNILPSLPTLDKIAEALGAELSVALVDLKTV